MRAIIKLTNKDRAKLKKLKKRESNNKIYRRYLYLEMSSNDMTNLKIAELLGVCNDTLTVWKQIFEESGLKGLSQLNYEGRRISKLEEHKDAIIKKIKDDKIATLTQLQDFLSSEKKLMWSKAGFAVFVKKTQSFLQKNSFNAWKTP